MKKIDKVIIISSITILVIIIICLNIKNNFLQTERDNLDKAYKECLITQPMCFRDNCIGQAGFLPAVEGNGFKFNASTYIEFDYDDLDFLGSRDFEILMLVKTDKDTIGDIISKGNSSKNWFAISQMNSAWRNEIFAQFDDGENRATIKSNHAIGYVWNRIRLKYERLNREWIVSFYLNGEVVDRVETGEFELLNNTYPLFLGTACGERQEESNTQGCFEYWGAIDNLVISDNGEPIIYLDFDHVEGNKILDMSGKGHDGIIKHVEQ